MTELNFKKQQIMVGIMDVDDLETVDLVYSIVMKALIKK